MDPLIEPLTIPRAFAVCALFGVLIACTVVGARECWRIPNRITYPANAVGVLAVAVWQDWPAHLLAGAAAFLALMLVSLWQPRVIGMGPAKLTAPIGFVVGPMVAAVIVLAASTGSLEAWLLRARGAPRSSVGAAPHLLGATTVMVILTAVV